MKLSQKLGKGILFLLFTTLSSRSLLAMDMDEIRQTVLAQTASSYGVTIEEMEFSLKCAPPEAHFIIKHLSDPNFLKGSNEFRYACLEGPPGTGKTTLAKAMAYKSNRDLKFYTPASFLRKERNATGEILIQELTNIASSAEKTLVVIDKINRLFENHESKNHDADTTACLFWSFIDSPLVCGNDNIFIIGTANRLNKIPEQIQDRFLPWTICLNNTLDNKRAQEVLFYKLSSLGIELSVEARNAILNIQKPKKKHVKNPFFSFEKREKLYFEMPTTARGIGNLAIAIQMKVGGKGEASINHIVEAQESIHKTVNRWNYGKTSESDEERAERHHKEMMMMQERHHKQTMEMQEKHHFASIFAQKKKSS